MLREFIEVFRTNAPPRKMGEDFSRMIQIAFDMTVSAGEVYFGKPTTPEERTRLYEHDVEVNRLERAIRKQVIAHLAVRGNAPSPPYCLLLVSLVKDVERLGDYAKNLAEVTDVRPEPLPNDDNTGELRAIRAGVESAFGVTAEVFHACDRERTIGLIQQGRDLAHRCDALVASVMRSDYDAGTAVAIAMGARFYKRLRGARPERALERGHAAPQAGLP